MKTVAIILAAGQSHRYGSDKMWVQLGDIPLWLTTYRAFAGSPQIDAVGIVCATGMEQEFRNLAPDAEFILAGGSSRQESCLAGVSAVSQEFEIVLVHDAARPFVTLELIERVVAATKEYGAAFPAIPVTDTIKQQVGETWQTLDRNQLVAIQTPQGAMRKVLLSSLQNATKEFTDESSLLESQGIPVVKVEGDTLNKKVTYPCDESSFIVSPVTKVGFGFDIHRFSTDPERKMWLGGIEFDHRPGLEGHSDADVLIHAIVDALLGAVSLGDIGLLYQNTDPRWKDCPSSLFLTETKQKLSELGWRISQIDATVIAEVPKIMPRKDEIRSKLAKLMEIDIDQVSIKATTNEGLGSIGRGEGIAAHAVATLNHQKPSN